ncbi:MAG: hypothetical protein O3A20_02305 [Planctomycetota bacterium]|nr:hypothetical protein [Planctomycetota bacterium]
MPPNYPGRSAWPKKAKAPTAKPGARIGLNRCTALGGLFRGPKDGSAWTAIGDNAYGGAHHVVVIPPVSGSQDVLLRVVNGKALRSADGGSTWTSPSGLSGLGEVRRVLRLDDAAKTVLLVGKTSAGFKLWRSIDRAQSFTQTRTITGQGSAILIAPSDVRFGGHESSGGAAFSLAAKINGVWKLYRTTDGGNTWLYRRDMPEMWSAFGTSITDENVICYGGVELWVSYDGGGNFDVVNRWWEHPGNRQFRLHADIMGVSVIPDASVLPGERWYVNTHGGTYESKTQLDKVNWISAIGLGVSQYYSTHTSRRDPKYVHAGAQDQGYQRSVLGAPGGGGPWADFTELITGDYGHISSANGSHDLVYSDYPGFVLVSEGEAAPVLRTVDFPAGFDGQWVPFLVADPVDTEVFYLWGS